MRRTAARPRPGHSLILHEGAQALVPALVTAMDAAQHQIRLETYIFDFTGAGALVGEALERAAQRGVEVCVLVDGLGTPSLPTDWTRRFVAAGVQWRVFSPVNMLALLLPGRWRRLHRKLCLVDGRVLFCGGINILDDFFDPSYGSLRAPRLDYAVQVSGPLVDDAGVTMARLWARQTPLGQSRHGQSAGTGTGVDGALARASGLRSGARDALRLGRTRRVGVPAAKPLEASAAEPAQAMAALLLRDNLLHRRRIESAYLRAIGLARREVLIANAYFVPGFKLRRALVLAAQRGVRVRLLLQGQYEYFMQYHAARAVYGVLLAAGVEIVEYAPSFLHAKVAVIDGRWATVGSSNLDPLSLLVANEANVVVDEAWFARILRRRLLHAIRTAGAPLSATQYARRPLRQRVFEYVAMLVMRLALLVSGKRY
ncbi:cardiolipin synthase ClsB [Variovorax sp. HJSM1_2]|uniref:cardiolipin synthase ClsB n=1 Tax=Variovorax sp. HJSM1_2 TaxID=3366263 RepID=UPI003BC7C693